MSDTAGVSGPGTPLSTVSYALAEPLGSIAPHWKPIHSFFVVTFALVIVAYGLPSNVYVIVLVPMIAPYVCHALIVVFVRNDCAWLLAAPQWYVAVTSGPFARPSARSTSGGQVPSLG